MGTKNTVHYLKQICQLISIMVFNGNNGNYCSPRYHLLLSFKVYMKSVYILGPDCNEFGYYVHLIIMNNWFFFLIKGHFRLTSMLKSSVTMTSTYNEQICFNKKEFESNANHPLAHISVQDGGWAGVPVPWGPNWTILNMPRTDMYTYR